MKLARWKAAGAYSLIWFSTLTVVRCSDVRSADIALYNGSGADTTGIRAISNMMEWMGYTVTLIGPDHIDSDELDVFRAICFPGGDMYQYAQDISAHGKDRIRQFISEGGGYIGICGGAYFTGERVIWQDTQLPMTPLAIFPGTTRGPLDEIAPFPYCKMCKVNIIEHDHPVTRAEPDSAWIIYCYGPALIPNCSADVDILGRYDVGGQPAMVAFSYGNGRIFMIGTHPEIEEDGDRDGTEFGDSFDDRGSDWELMKNAVRWCLKE